MLATHSVRQLVHFARVGFQPVQDRLETILPTLLSAEIPASQRVGAPQASFRGFVLAIEAAFELVRRHAVLLHISTPAVYGRRAFIKHALDKRDASGDVTVIQGMLHKSTPAVYGRRAFIKHALDNRDSSGDVTVIKGMLHKSTPAVIRPACVYQARP